MKYVEYQYGWNIYIPQKWLQFLNNMLQLLLGTDKYSTHICNHIIAY